MFDAIGKIRPQLRSRAWASPGQPGQTLDDLQARLVEAGNVILEVDEENQRILVAENEGAGEDVWGCRICLAKGKLVIVDTESELINHCDECHEGWRAF